METQGWKRIEGPFQQYLLSSGKSKNTVTTYCSGVSILWRWAAQYETDAMRVTRSDLRAWFAERLAVVSPSRAHNDLAGLKLFYAWLLEIEYREDDPTTGIRIKRGKRLPTEPLLGTELDGLLGAAESERDRLIILVLAMTGLRVSELASLQAEDINWTKGEITIRGKGDKERRIAPNPDMLNRLHAFTGMFPSGPVWLSDWGRPLAGHQIRKIIYRIAEKAHLQGVHPHRFRSYFATEFIDQFKDIQALQGLLGHEDLATTARYSEYTRERRGLDSMRRFKAPGAA